MFCKDRMRKELIIVNPSAAITEAARKMRDECVGAILVVEGEALKGILTDRDVALAVAAEGKNPDTTRASDIMASEPKTIDSGQHIETALRLMREANVRRLPVIENGKLVGLLSMADLAIGIREQFDQFVGLEEAFALT